MLYNHIITQKNDVMIIGWIKSGPYLSILLDNVSTNIPIFYF